MKVQNLQTLPQEILSAPRFVKTGNKGNYKAPYSGWQQPENQHMLNELSGIVGFIAATERHGGLVFYDFDHVLNDQGEFVNENAEKWYKFLHSPNTYCEKSNSGHGLHIFAEFNGEKFFPGNPVLHFDKNCPECKLEVFYGTNKNCLVTGNLFNCRPNAPVIKGDIAETQLRKVIDAIKQQEQKTRQQPAQFPEYDAQYNIFSARRMLDFIPPADLSRDDWFHIGAALKTNGNPYSDWELWSSRDTSTGSNGRPRFSEIVCEKQWATFKTGSWTIKTIHDFAKQYGYNEKDVWHEYHDAYKRITKTTRDTRDEDPKIVQWQTENGAINPELLAKLKAQAARINAETDLVAAAHDTTTVKFLGAFGYYSFYADITEKFLARIKTARDDAKAKISDYKKQTSNSILYAKVTGKNIDDVLAEDKPSEYDYSLTEVNPTALKNDIAKYKTAAAREHKKYLAQKDIDDQNEKIQAEREAYNEAPKTTKTEIVDCPVDLILPHGVYFSNTGIKIVDYDKPVGRYGRPVIEACQNPVVPVKVYRETDKNFTQYEIAIKTDNVWRYATFDGRTLEDARAISELSNYGVHISNPRALAQYFAKIIATNERNGKIKRIKVYKQPGWQDDDPKCENFICPTGGDDYIVKNGNFDYKGIFTPKGDPDKWRKMFNRVLFHDPKNYEGKTITIEDMNGKQTTYTPDNNPSNISSTPNLVAATTIGFAMGAPLIKLLGIRNPQMIFGFDSGNGKTAAAKFAVSFFGRPDRGLAPTLNATQNYLEDLSAKINDFPHVVDELQSAKKKQRENLDEWLYNFTSGVTRGRADIKGHALPTYNYKGCRLFTGEQTITNDNSGNGAISRIFEIKKAELFADPFAIEIHQFVQENYGHFGKYFTTEFIPENRDRIKKYFENLREVIAYGSMDLLSNHATILAFAFTGLRFTLEALGYDNAEEITINILEASQELIDEAPTKKEATNMARALPELIDFADTHPKNFIEEKSHSPSDELYAFNPADGNEIYGVKMLDGRTAFFPSALKKILGRELDFPSAQAIIRSFGKAGFLEGSNSRIRPFQSRLPNYFYHWFGKDRRFYVFKSPKELEKLMAA